MSWYSNENEETSPTQNEESCDLTDSRIDRLDEIQEEPSREQNASTNVYKVVWKMVVKPVSKDSKQAFLALNVFEQWPLCPPEDFLFKILLFIWYWFSRRFQNMPFIHKSEFFLFSFGIYLNTYSKTVPLCLTFNNKSICLKSCFVFSMTYNISRCNNKEAKWSDSYKRSILIYCKSFTWGLDFLTQVWHVPDAKIVSCAE